MGFAVLGSGSWGTALAMQLARAGHVVTLWGRDSGAMREMAASRENPRYLPGHPLPPGLTPTDDLEAAVRGGSKLIVCAVPSHAVRETFALAAHYLASETIVVSATKGIEEGSSKRISEVLSELCGERASVAVLSGPSFAKEVASELPTVLTAAAASEVVAKTVQHRFSTALFRVYTSTDVVGVEIGGSVKNVIALAAGVSDGIGFGNNSRAAIITRGLAEVSRLAVRLGADPVTMTGLSGLGDLVLTCTGDLSRNRTVGLRLGRGERLADIIASMNQVAEGVRNTAATHDLAVRLGVEMPITHQVRQLLFEDKPARQVVVDLMSRQLKAEFSRS